MVDIRDVAIAALQAEKYGRPGERYIIANEFISNREFYNMAAAEGGQKPVKVIPRSVAWGIAWVADGVLKLLRKKDYLLKPEAVFLSNVFQQLDNSKARRELHWEPRPVADTVRDAVAWYRANPPAE